MDAKYRAKGYESYRFSHGKNRFYDLILRQIGKNVLIQVKLIHLDTYIWNFHLDPVGSLPVAVGHQRRTAVCQTMSVSELRDVAQLGF